jgi:hypothetical protein
MNLSSLLVIFIVSLGLYLWIRDWHREGIWLGLWKWFKRNLGGAE